MKCYKRAFTLIEICIVLVILSIAGSVVGIRIYESIRKYRFEHSAQRLKSHLQLCRDLSLTSCIDLSCSFYAKPNGLSCVVSCPETDNVLRGLTKVEEVFEGIYLKDSSLKNSVIHFYSTGAIAGPSPFWVCSSSQDLDLVVFDAQQRQATVTK